MILHNSSVSLSVSSARLQRKHDTHLLPNSYLFKRKLSDWKVYSYLTHIMRVLGYSSHYYSTLAQMGIWILDPAHPKPAAKHLRPKIRPMVPDKVIFVALLQKFGSVQKFESICVGIMLLWWPPYLPLIYNLSKVSYTRCSWVDFNFFLVGYTPSSPNAQPSILQELEWLPPPRLPVPDKAKCLAMLQKFGSAQKL